MRRGPDPKTGKPNPEALKAFAASHPESAGFSKFVADHNPPVSWATIGYYGVHTFKFINQDNAVTLVRWRFVPQDGEHLLSGCGDDDQAREFSRTDTDRPHTPRTCALGHGGDDSAKLGDPEDNPTLAWPKDRKELTVGTLTISSAMDQKGGGCADINYDPLVMGEGIAATNDPVLLFRSPSYGVSYSKRLEGK